MQHANNRCLIPQVPGNHRKRKAGPQMIKDKHSQSVPFHYLRDCEERNILLVEIKVFRFEQNTWESKESFLKFYLVSQEFKVCQQNKNIFLNQD